MKRLVQALLLAVLFIAITVGMATLSIHRVSTYGQEINRQKTALVQVRLDETLDLLTDLSKEEYIRDPEVTYLEKAEFLTDMNQTEGLGYMMVRILDSEVNIYKEGLGVASNLGSRDYMQRMYATGEQQVTDAFLAGADGKTINYTVTAAIVEDGQVTGALMAAIYGTEIDGYLQEENTQNVLVGSQLQYMGGISEEQFGLAVGQVLESEQQTFRPVEEVLQDFHEQQGGSFWGIGGGIQYFTYSPVEHCQWMVMTQVDALPLIGGILVGYACCLVILGVVAFAMVRRNRKSA